MMKPDSDLQSRRILKSAGLYCTRCRLAILKVLAKADSPLSQDQIARRLGKTHLNKVTIYRTLESFRRAGLVHKAYTHKKVWQFELADNCSRTQCHPHFTCKNCGVTHCLIGLSYPIIKGLKKGFVTHRQRVQLEGLCPKCSPNPRTYFENRPSNNIQSTVCNPMHSY